MSVVGVDGARIDKKQGWIAVALSSDGARPSYHPSFAQLLQSHAEAHVVAVDIPIGLAAAGGRAADGAARRILRSRSSSVFSAPVRDVLRAQTYAEACELSFARCGKRLSKQTWMIVERIREVDACLDDGRVFEVHPEVSFRLLAGECLPPKKTWNGQMLRRELLARAGIHLEADAGDAGRAPADDLLDAAVAAWSAARIAAGEACRLPETCGDRDGTRDVCIWA